MSGEYGVDTDELKRLTERMAEVEARAEAAIAAMNAEVDGLHSPRGDNISPKEWIQVAGTADRLTVEAKFFSKYGLYRQYVVGRKEARTEQSETESIQFGEHQIPVRPSEVLTAAEAIQLFLYFYDNNRVEAGWHLRELPDYAESQT